MKLETLMNNAVIVTSDNGADTLFSYDTEIITVKDGEVTNVTSFWDYSTTTGKHLNAFLNRVGMFELAKMTKAQKTKHFQEKGLI